MRFGTTLAVMVLATGVICAGADAPASPPPTVQPKVEGATPVSKPKTAVSVIVWKAIEARPEHALLKSLVGHWTTKVHVFEGQLAHGRDAEGTADGKLLLGGLFLQLTQSETRNKQAFEGMKIYGWNEALGKYTADAYDTVATANIHFVGTYDAAKKQLNMSVHHSDEKMKTLIIARSVTKFVDEKTWTYEEFIQHGANDTEHPVVAIVFTRG